MLDTIKYGAAGLYFEFTWESYVGLAMFVLANVAGTIVFVRFIRVQPLNRQIFFSTIPPTSTFVFLMLFFFTITMREQTDIVTAVRVGLGIGDPTTRYIWMIVIVAVYVLFLYLTYSGLSKPVKKIEKVVEKLRNGKTKTVYEKDKKTLILQPAVLMAATVNETSGKVLVLNAETD